MSFKPVFAAALAATLAPLPVAAGEPLQSQANPIDAATLARTVAGDPEARRPLAKLRGRLCLVVAAEDEAFAEAVAARIVDNAQAAGVPTRSAGCTPNALVNFTDEPRAQLQAVRDDGRKLFRRMSEKEIDAALAARDPAYVFQAIERTPRLGEGDAFTGVSASGDNWTSERSALRTPEDLVTTMVVVDRSAVAGFSPVQLADYVTLRLLAPTGEIAGDHPEAPRTILSLFAAPGAAPAEMTAFDRAYLRTLYRLPRTAFAEEVLDEVVRVAAK